MPNNPVIFWELGAKNAQKLCEFYAHLFDWQIEVKSEDYHLLHTGAGGIDGGVCPARDSKARRPILYALVDDLHRYLYRAVERGGRVSSPIRETDGGAGSAILQDVEGNPFGLLKAQTPDY